MNDRTSRLDHETIRAIAHRLFVHAPNTALRKEDEQKCRELSGLLALIARVRSGAHVVDAAAGKSSVGLVAAELLSIGRLTIIERDPRRVAACREAATRVQRDVAIEVQEGDVRDPASWPEAPDVVVALHACGPAADGVIDGAIRSHARHVFIAPCCYGTGIPFHAEAASVLARSPFLADDLIRRRMAALLIDTERALRLEAAGYETVLEEFVAPTVTPHNVVFIGRRTLQDVRMRRADARLASLRDGAVGAATLTPQTASPGSSRHGRGGLPG